MDNAGYMDETGVYGIIYLDVFFLLNFWLDLLLLLVVRYITRQYRVFACIAAALFASALGTAGLLVYLRGIPGIFLVVGEGAAVLLMAWMAFGKEGLLWHTLLVLIAGGLLSAALSFALFAYKTVAGRGKNADLPVLVIVSMTCAAACLLLERQCRIRFKEEHMKAKAVLEFGNRRMVTTALIDTGNRLYDPFYHKPVILVDETMLENVLRECRECRPERLQYIPFHSVGCENGMLDGLMLDAVSIRWQEKTWKFAEVIAASAKAVLYRGKEYQVIFHCGLFEE